MQQKINSSRTQLTGSPYASVYGWIFMGLIFVQPLEASIVLTIPSSPPTVANDFSAPPIELDLNKDSVLDFVIPGGSTQINVRPEIPNRVLAIFEQGSHFSAALAEGSFIGATPDEDSLVWRGGR